MTRRYVPRVGVEAGEEQRGNSRSSSEVTDSQLLIKNGLGEDLVYNRAKGISLFLQQAPSPVHQEGDIHIQEDLHSCADGKKHNSTPATQHALVGEPQSPDLSFILSELIRGSVRIATQPCPVAAV
ncbi:unnamed protein product [Timema podura]|uniref:Uncharacterized protein n=1 Tax=Timema podura TaxID=61482 RepID=A0ABN7PHE8_TIMPD|nr:unnamed protein product [Timema podura]